MSPAALITLTIRNTWLITRLSSATVLLLLAAGLPVPAKAGFVVSLGLNVPVTTATTTDINFGGAAETPFRFQGFYTDAGTHGIRLVDANTGAYSPNLVRFNLGEFKIQRLNFADSIGDGDDFLGSSRLLHGLNGGNIDLEGDWALGRPLQNLSGYIGLKFAAAGNPSNIHYGWIHYTATSTSTSAPFSTGVINGWGYNTTPGEAILAGVPEPSTAALLSGLATVFGVLNRRRRRD